MSRPLCVMLVAAEASGDLLGADLARAFRARLGDGVTFVGVGGDRLAHEGVRSPFPIAELSVLGLLEGVAAYPRVRRRARETADLARRERPDVAVLIDSWGFTLRVAQRLRRLDPALPLVKYVGPQVWASRPGRARTLARAVDLLLSLHAFDAPWFERAGLRTVFVGHPAFSRDLSTADPERFRREIGATADQPILLVLPGSRAGEVARLTAPFADAVRRLRVGRPDLKVVMALASTVAQQVKYRLADWPEPVILVEADATKADAMAAATVALACSGSITTELALHGCPMVVGYRLGGLTHAILKRLVTTKYINLLNIAAGAAVAPELVQNACTGENLERTLGRLLDEPDLRARQIQAQNDALDKMGRGVVTDPSMRAVEAILALLQQRKPVSPAFPPA